MADRTVKVVLQAATEQYERGMNKAADATGKVVHAGGRIGQTFHGFSKTVAEADGAASQIAGTLTGVGLATAAVGAAAVKSFADFDEAMAGVQVASRETGENLQKLRDMAMQLGADTAFSATEAAQGIENLARAGVSTGDILGGGMKGSLDLAAAGQMDVADAAELAATAMTQFKLSGQDVPHVADLLAAGAGKAMGDVSDLGQALKQAGLVSSQFGLSIEETTGGLAAFAQAGMLGSDAGTSFKSMLLRLANPAGETAKIMDELGISAYDAQGNFVGLAEFAGILKEKLGKLSDQERQQKMAQIFGTDAIRAAAILYEEGAEGIQEWIDAVDQSGYASEQASGYLDNLKGDLTKLGGSLGTLTIKMGEVADGPLRWLTKGIIDMVNALAKTPGAAQTLFVITGGLAGLTLGAAGLVKTVQLINNTKVALLELGVSERAVNRVSGALGKMARGATAAAVKIGIVVGAMHMMQANIPEMSGLNKSFDEIGKTMELVASGAENLDVLFADNTRAFFEAKEGGFTAAEAMRDLAEANDSALFAYDRFMTGITGVQTLMTENENRVKAYGEQLTKLPLDKAQKMFGLLKASADEGGMGLDQLLGYTSAYRDQVKAMAAEAGETNLTNEELAALMSGEMVRGLQMAADGTMLLNAEQAKAQKSAEELAKQQEAVNSALDDAKQRYTDMSRRSVMVDDALKQLTDEMGANELSAEDVAEAVSAAEQAYSEMAGAIADSAAAFIDVSGTIEQFAEDAKFNLDGYLDSLREQVQAQEEWRSNMVMLTGRASDELIQYLAELGPEGAQLVKALAEGTDAQLADMERSFAARGEAATGAMAGAFLDANVVWAELAKAAGEGAVEAARKEVAAGKTTLKQVIDKYDLEFKIGADTSQADQSVRAAIARISKMRADVQVGAYHKAGLDAPMATGGFAGHAAAALGLANGGAPRRVSGLLEGPGTTTSDSIPAMLSRREFVTNADATSHYGVDAMYALNAKRVNRELLRAIAGLPSAAPRFAAGGSSFTERPRFVTTASWPAPPQAETRTVTSAAPKIEQHIYGGDSREISEKVTFGVEVAARRIGQVRR